MNLAIYQYLHQNSDCVENKNSPVPRIWYRLPGKQPGIAHAACWKLYDLLETDFRDYNNMEEL